MSTVKAVFAGQPIQISCFTPAEDMETVCFGTATAAIASFT